MAIKIVIVDDHEIILDGLQSLLQLANDMEVIGTATCYNDLLHIIDKKVPDILLLDIGLPGISGLEIAEKLKVSHPGIKTIILTANCSEENVFKALEIGVGGFIPKNAGKKTLEEAIRSVFNGEEYFDNSIAKIVIKKFTGNKEKHGPKETSLTAREREITKYICEGLTHKEISEQLFISKRTVDTHVQNIMEKLNLHSKVELIKYAVQKGMFHF